MRYSHFPTLQYLLLTLLLLFGGGCAESPSPGSVDAEYTADSLLAEEGEGEVDLLPLLEGEGYPVEIVDDAGRSVTFEAPPARILSLVPSATEILLALGVGDLLVGRTEYDLDPRIASLPSVGGGLEPSLERVVALAPDLVLLFRGESDLGTPRLLESADIPYLAVRPDNIGDIRRILAILGRSVDRGARAAELMATMDRELSEVSDRVQSAPRRKTAFLLGGDPPLVAGRGTYLHELIEMAGGENVFADVGALYAPVSLETFVQNGVEIILVLGEAGIPPTLSHLPAHIIPAQLPGLGVGASARAIAEIFHPELFP